MFVPMSSFVPTSPQQLFVAGLALGSGKEIDNRSHIRGEECSSLETYILSKPSATSRSLSERGLLVSPEVCGGEERMASKKFGSYFHQLI